MNQRNWNTWEKGLAKETHPDPELGKDGSDKIEAFSNECLSSEVVHCNCPTIPKTVPIFPSKGGEFTTQRKHGSSSQSMKLRDHIFDYKHKAELLRVLQCNHKNNGNSSKFECVV
ncbi:hypothetical protein STEG23_000397 [Scotinomys teguina]